MSYQAHRSHRGTYTEIRPAPKGELNVIVCGQCGLDNFSSAIMKPCTRKLPPEASSPSPQSPVDPEVIP